MSVVVHGRGDGVPLEACNLDVPVGMIIENAIVVDAVDVNGDVADIVGGCGIAYRQYLRIGERLYGAADGAGVLGRADLRVHVVAVGNGAAAALQAHGVHGGDVGVGAGFHAVLKGGCAAVAPAPDATDIVSATIHTVDGAGEDAALDGGGGFPAVADDAAGVVAADVECGGDDAVLNEVGAVGKAHEARGVVACRGDGARHCQVLDGGTVDVMERSHALLICASTRRRAADVGSDGVAVAEEGAAEGFVAAQAHRGGDVDVGIQSDEFAAVVSTLTHREGKPIPKFSAGDEVGVVHGAGAC